MSATAVGKAYAPYAYSVGREKIREYAAAVGETDPLYFDLQAARGAGHADLVAPPMFAAVYSRMAVAQPLFDPEVGVDFARMVHGAQEFEWGPLVIAGDEISTVVTVKDIAARGGMCFYVFETVSTNRAGERVCRGTWTNIVRSGNPAAEPQDAGPGRPHETTDKSHRPAASQAGEAQLETQSPSQLEALSPYYRDARGAVRFLL